MNDVLKSGYYGSPLEYDCVGWLVNEVMNLENKMAFYIKNSKKDINMTGEDEEQYRKNNICRICQKKISVKVRDHWHLAGKLRGPADNKCNVNVKQKQSNFTPFVFPNFSNYDSHRFFKKLVDKKKGEVNFKNIPQTNEEYISVSYGCLRFIDSNRPL